LNTLLGTLFFRFLAGIDAAEKHLNGLGELRTCNADRNANEKCDGAC